MAKGKKKKKDLDFKKVKLRVGKVLKKTQSTDTSISAKKLVLIDQLRTVQPNASSTIVDLCRQLGHHNINMRRDALHSLRQQLSHDSSLIGVHLRILIPEVGRLLTDAQLLAKQAIPLRALLATICEHTCESDMRPHFALLVAHIAVALSDGTRMFALIVGNSLLTIYPRLCIVNVDLFDAYLQLFAALHKHSLPVTKRQLAVASLLRFLRVYTDSRIDDDARKTMLSIRIDFATSQCQSFELVNPTTAPFDFPIFANTTSSGSKSPLDNVTGLARLWDCAFPLLFNIFVEIVNDTNATALLTDVIQALIIFAQCTIRVHATVADAHRLVAHLSTSRDRWNAAKRTIIDKARRSGVGGDLRKVMRQYDQLFASVFG